MTAYMYISIYLYLAAIPLVLANSKYIPTKSPAINLIGDTMIAALWPILLPIIQIIIWSEALRKALKK